MQEINSNSTFTNNNASQENANKKNNNPIKLFFIISAHVLGLTLALGLVFFILIFSARFFLMGRVQQNVIPWLYFILYVITLLVVGIPYVIINKKIKNNKK